MHSHFSLACNWDPVAGVVIISPHTSLPYHRSRQHHHHPFVRLQIYLDSPSCTKIHDTPLNIIVIAIFIYIVLNIGRICVFSIQNVSVTSLCLHELQVLFFICVYTYCQDCCHIACMKSLVRYRRISICIYTRLIKCGKVTIINEVWTTWKVCMSNKPEHPITSVFTFEIHFPSNSHLEYYKHFLDEKIIPYYWLHFKFYSMFKCNMFKIMCLWISSPARSYLQLYSPYALYSDKSPSIPHAIICYFSLTI